METYRFDAGPPPQLNTLKRLAQEVNAVSTELERARADDGPTAVGLKLAEKAEKSGGRDFRKSAAKKVDFDGEEKVFTSLLNLTKSPVSNPHTRTFRGLHV